MDFFSHPIAIEVVVGGMNFVLNEVIVDNFDISFIFKSCIENACRTRIFAELEKEKSQLTVVKSGKSSGVPAISQATRVKSIFRSSKSQVRASEILMISTCF